MSATKRSWKTNPVIQPRFLQTAIRKGLRMADSINIEEANDKSWLRITFKKWPVEADAAPAPEETK